MRLLLLAAAAAVLLVAARAPAGEPPALLVLRAACPARDPAAFATRALRLAPTLRLLTYSQTCGAEWPASVTRAALAALSEGRAVALVGWAGAAACEALEAAALALRRAPPEACVTGEARGAAVARLAARLGWRRTLLPALAPRSECAAALRHVARALNAAGLPALHSETSFDATTLFPYVVILCASRENGVNVGALARDVVRGAAAVLLLHVDEPHMPPPTSPAAYIDDAFLKSNIDLVNDKHYISKNNDRPSSTLDLSSWTLHRERPDEVAVPARPARPAAHGAEFPGAMTSRGRRGRRERRSVLERSRRTRRPDYLFAKIEENSPQGDLLLLTDERLDDNDDNDDDEGSPQDYDSVVKKALETIDRIVIAERTRTQLVRCIFHLYRRSRTGPGTGESRGRGRDRGQWGRVALVTAESTRSLDLGFREWRTEVVLSNVSDGLRGGTERGEGEEDEEASRSGAGGGGGSGGVWAGASLALGGAAGAALGGRWAAVRRRRARRAADVVLLAADFTFPADERRVGDGMETMLSCWLQQLHEFGGPELERPDLLPRALVAPAVAPAMPPRAPSAPSSTCSVNRIALDRRIRYKGDPVHLKYLQIPDSLELKRKAIDVLLVMQSLRHDNLNPFIGWVSSPRAALVFEEGGRGSLEDVLRADEIKLDWTFRLSLLSDLVKGMRYLHASPLRVHGRLSSRNCVVDSRWVLRITDYGLPAFHRAQPSTGTVPPLPHRAAHELLWTAPELLRDPAAAARGSQPGDVFAFAIIMQEVIVRGEPYCMLALTPEEIVEKVSRPPPLIRPSVSMGAAPPEAVSVMRQCWSEAPDARPDFHRLHDIFRHLHRGRKINIVDSMFEMLEKYSNNLEELIKERTEQLDMEKKKTEQLLNRMLPRSVAERLLLGSRVEPEEFEEVSIYFSDIVGFTALAARSTPVQVVDLLNDLYTTFDAAIEQYRVYKVETIGDAYMVVGGLPTRTRDHAESVATMALHLLHLAGRFRIRHLPETPLHLRIGLHTGPCCAGVVGLTMPRYCLFGDTVNTASRMESTGAAWRVQVSAATAARLLAAGDYRLRSRGLTQVKGKGAMHTYWLLGKDGFDKPLPTPPPLPSEEVLFETDGENDSEASSSGAAPASPPAPTPPPAPPPGGPAGRSGAVSADSSPPAAPRARLAAAASVDRYRFAGGANAGGRVLRRQWSLERGEALAAAAAGDALGEGAPLALLAPIALRAPHPRYRTRPGPPPPPPPSDSAA